jgi:hypothetical protein
MGGACILCMGELRELRRNMVQACDCSEGPAVRVLQLDILDDLQCSLIGVTHAINGDLGGKVNTGEADKLAMHGWVSMQPATCWLCTAVRHGQCLKPVAPHRSLSCVHSIQKSAKESKQLAQRSAAGTTRCASESCS